MPVGIKKKILKEIENYTNQLRGLEESFSYDFKDNDAFQIFIDTRASLTIKISNAEKKLFLYSKTGSIYGDKVEYFGVD